MPYAYLDCRIDVMSNQMTELMQHFRTMAATPGTPLAVTQVAATTTTTDAPVVTLDTPMPQTALEPTPDMQAPPAVSASNAELIGNHPVMQLTYTPRSQLQDLSKGLISELLKKQDKYSTLITLS
jgi:hypothetical protein